RHPATLQPDTASELTIQDTRRTRTGHRDNRTERVLTREHAASGGGSPNAPSSTNARLERKPSFVVLILWFSFCGLLLFLHRTSVPITYQMV
ncbi:hypothetical protein, partial [Nocardia seriolae]|uniref:hypothetical protein n=1 Tax=Nocardia seriolae TaxID=37332 RepID=UPI001C0E14B8